MKNIELKTYINDFKETRKLLKDKGFKFEKVMKQIDTYYDCSKGKLKIRKIDKKTFELIFYKRPESKKPRLSNYFVLKIPKLTIHEAKRILKLIFKQKAIIKKERELWLFKNTRIHLDKVEKIGKFLELETIAKNISLNQAKRECAEVIKLLDIDKYKPCNKSYVDLLK